MPTSILARASALAFLLGLAAACKSTVAPPPSHPGDWHFEGGSSALYSTSNGGDFGDTDVIAFSVEGGQFVLDQLLVEGIVSVNDTNFEDSANNELETTTMQLGVGARYYTNPEGSSRPYLAAQVGFDHFDVNDDFTGADESDTSPFVEARLGLEAFVGNATAVDMGVSWQEVFSRDIGSSSDDISTFGVFVGFSVWL